MTPFLAVLGYVIAVLALGHSAYSAYEFALLRKHVLHVSTDQALPLDITVEAVVGIVVFCVATVLHQRGNLKPIMYAKSAALLEKAGKNPYAMLEIRPVFQDVTAIRQRYAQWEKEGKDQS